MKQTHWIILIISLTLVGIGYVAYCWRGFYLKPPLEFEKGITDSEKDVVQKWYSGIAVEKESWNWKLAARTLLLPFGGRAGGYVSAFDSVGEDSLIVQVKGRKGVTVFARDGKGGLTYSQETMWMK